MVLYKSALSIERITELFRERAVKYQDVPGLVQKFYVRDPVTGEVGGIYIFDNQDSLDRFKGSDLGQSIGDTYRFISFALSDLMTVDDVAARELNLGLEAPPGFEPGMEVLQI
jgi:hypothetical protein